MPTDIGGSKDIEHRLLVQTKLVHATGEFIHSLEKLVDRDILVGTELIVRPSLGLFDFFITDLFRHHLLLLVFVYNVTPCNIFLVTKALAGFIHQFVHCVDPLMRTFHQLLRRKERAIDRSKCSFTRANLHTSLVTLLAHHFSRSEGI